MAAANYIGIDLGTSFIKGSVIDVSRMAIGSVHRLRPPDVLPNANPLIHELDPDEILKITRQLIAELLTEADDCHGILISGQMGGLVLSSPTGESRSNYISWLDRRLLMPYPGEQRTYFDTFRRRCDDGAPQTVGNEFRPGLPLPFLFWLQETGQLANGHSCIPVTLPDFVAAALCRTRPVMEWTSATGSLNLQQRCFPREMILAAGIGHLTWPDLVSYRDRAGICETEGRRLPVYAAVGDHQCALAGTLLAARELSVNISTGSQVSILTNHADCGDFQLRPYFDGQFLRTITNIPAGRALSSLMMLLTETSQSASHEIPPEAWDYFFSEAERTQSSDVGVNLAFFPGPVAGPGAICGLREDNLTVGHLARATLQQMAKYYHQFALKVVPDGNFDRVVFSGGIAQRSEFLRTLILEKLHKPHRLTSDAEDALLGLMVLGRVIHGLAPNVAESGNQVRERHDQTRSG